MKLVLLSLCLFLTEALFAQTLPDSFSLQNHQRKVELLVARNQQLIAGKKATYPHLIASSVYAGLNDTPVVDTANYFYSSASRGARFDYNMMRYENFYSPALNSSFNDVPFTGHYLQPKPYILCDSSIRIIQFSNGRDTFIDKLTYTPQDKIADYTMFRISGPTFGKYRIAHLYNAQNELYRLIDLAWNDTISQWDTNAVKSIYYDAFGRAVKDTTSLHGKIYTATNYSYDAQGNIILVEGFWDRMDDGALDPWEKYVCTYDSKNRLTHVDLFETYVDTAYTSLLKDSFGYTGNTPFHTYWETTWRNPQGIWEQSRLVTKHLNAQELPDSVFGMNGPSDLMIFTYNSNGYPTGYRQYITGVPYQTIHYYYDAATLGMPEAQALQEQITLYPNPATNQLNLSWADFTAGTTGVEIINTTGQVVLRDELSWQQSNQSLSIAGLQPGIYWVTLTDAQGNAIFRQAMVKQ